MVEVQVGEGFISRGVEILPGRIVYIVGIMSEIDKLHNTIQRDDLDGSLEDMKVLFDDGENPCDDSAIDLFLGKIRKEILEKSKILKIDSHWDVSREVGDKTMITLRVERL